MQYSQQRRRLDYLLLTLQGVSLNTSNELIKTEILKAINILIEKRNKMILQKT